MDTLTRTQRRLRDDLQRKISLDGRAPSLREAASYRKVSHAAVARTLRALEAKGLLKREGHYGRTLHLLTGVRESRPCNAAATSRLSGASR